MICQAQSKTENRVKRVAVYSDCLALQCGLIGYTIDTINGRTERTANRIAMRFVAVKTYTLSDTE